MANPFVHVELNTTDVRKLRTFTVRCSIGNGRHGHGAERHLHRNQSRRRNRRCLLKNPMPGVPSFWLSYVLVDDIHAATEKARSLGAQIV
jgi:hypothetical protein